ncbi:hypothetical protein N752_05625 [Desulforamulus aquiferis]|nr:hypothetical protein N752_05625 [Desulforamulus aquiferis]
MYQTQCDLAEITGMDAFTLQPAAGAHGEMTGMLIIKAYLESKGETGRNKVIVPDSAHGTNPATATLCGFKVVEVKSDSRGGVDLEALKQVLGPDVAALCSQIPAPWDYLKIILQKLPNWYMVLGAYYTMTGPI